jgi:hypothetical protein
MKLRGTCLMPSGNSKGSLMMIDVDSLKQLLRINDELFQLCTWLNEKRDMETSSHLIPLVDDLTQHFSRSGQEEAP